MAFLEEYDALVPDDVQERIRLFFHWVQTDARALFHELRQRRPVLDTPLFLVVSRWTDVIELLSRPGTFNVNNVRSMDPSVGPFMLARDLTELNWHEKSIMRSIMRFEDLPAIRAFASTTAAAVLAESAKASTIDITTTISRFVPVRVVQECFGFPGPDVATMSRWSKATQYDMFYNPLNDPQIHSANVQSGTEMQEWVRGFLEQRQPWASAKGEDAVSRLLRMTQAEFSAFDPSRVVSNICGLLVGAVETMSQAINHTTEQILLRPKIATRAIAAAKANEIDRLDPIVWEALRFNPIAPFVQRIAREDSVLAPGSDHATPIKAGRIVAAAIGSAMFDPDVFPDPDEFHEDRPGHLYLHTGFGHHECLGKYVALTVVPEVIRHILMLPGVHLLEGANGKIDNANGPFPEHFTLGITPDANHG
jgi:cytochrome P450